MGLHAEMKDPYFVGLGPHGRYAQRRLRHRDRLLDLEWLAKHKKLVLTQGMVLAVLMDDLRLHPQRWVKLVHLWVKRKAWA